MEDSSWDIIFRESTRFWVQYVLVPSVVIAGGLGNCATICVLTKKKMRNSSNIYLTALALSDLFFLLFSYSMSWMHYDFMKSVRLYWNYIPVGLWLTDASSSTSVWLTVSFTIERYLAVCHPMMLKRPLTQTRALLVCFSVYILCFLSTSSTPFEWKVTESPENYSLTDENSSKIERHTVTYDLVSTELGKNASYKFVYHWFSTVTFVILPWIILVIGNIFLICSLRKSVQERDNLTNRRLMENRIRKMRQEDRITLTLVAVVIVFMICQMPTAVVLIYTAVHTPVPGSPEENVLLGLGNICNFLVAINAACNFVLYTALSDNYRRVLLETFCCGSLRDFWRRRNFQTPTAFNLQRLGRQQALMGQLTTSLIVNPGSYLQPGSDDGQGQRVICSTGAYHIYNDDYTGESMVFSRLILRNEHNPNPLSTHNASHVHLEDFKSA